MGRQTCGRKVEVEMLRRRSVEDWDVKAQQDIYTAGCTVRKMNSTLRQIELIPKTQTDIARKFKRKALR
jgi:hypothetical protein